MHHPLYDDEALVREVTRQHLVAGRTIFQLWQAGTEREHSERMLDIVAPPHRGLVLSLGCGVGGMERYWQLMRPDLRFVLQNRSRSQLDACLCRGSQEWGDVEDFRLLRPGGYDVVVLAYLLGHVDAARVLDLACTASCGTVLVLDVTPEDPADFAARLHYTPPRAQMLRSFGFELHPIVNERWRVAGLNRDTATDAQCAAVLRSRPAVWVRRA